MTIGHWQYTDALRLSVSRTNADGTYEGTLTSNPVVQSWIALGNAPLDPVELPVQVPKSVTKRQARQALIKNHMIDGVEAAINGISDPMKRELMRSEWNDSQVFERDRPALLELAGVLDLSSEQLDALFIQAAAL